MRPPGPVLARVRPASRWLAPAAIWLISSTLTYLRVPAAGRGVVYAEDGSRFLQDWLLGRWWVVPFMPFGGYQQFIPRLASAPIVQFLPISWWAEAVTVMASIVLGGITVLVYLLSGHTVQSVIARLGLAGIVVLVPLAGNEAVGTLNNLHWYVLFLLPWVLMARPKTLRATVWLAILALALVMTEPQCVFFAPLACYLALRRRTSRLIVSGWFLGVAIQALTLLLAPRFERSGVPPFASALKGYLLNVSLTNVTSSSHALGSMILSTQWWAAWAVFMLFVGFAVVGWIYGCWSIRVMLASVLTASIASWFASFYVNNVRGLYYSQLSKQELAHVPLVRWGTGGAMLLTSVVPLAAAALAPRVATAHHQAQHPIWRRIRQLLPSVLVLALLVMMSFSFISRSSVRVGPNWARSLTDARQLCKQTGSRQITVPIAPRGWGIKLSCLKLG